MSTAGSRPTFRAVSSSCAATIWNFIQAWILEWRGCGVTFEIVPVVTSAEARAIVEPYLELPEPPA